MILFQCVLPKSEFLRNIRKSNRHERPSMESVGLCLGTPFKLKGLRFITITECGHSVDTEWMSLPLTNVKYEDVEQEKQHWKEQLLLWRKNRRRAEVCVWKLTPSYILFLNYFLFQTWFSTLYPQLPLTPTSHWSHVHHTGLMGHLRAMNHLAVATSAIWNTGTSCIIQKCINIHHVVFLDPEVGFIVELK